MLLMKRSDQQADTSTGCIPDSSILLSKETELEKKLKAIYDKANLKVLC